jgi:hypothetical protein
MNSRRAPAVFVIAAFLFATVAQDLVAAGPANAPGAPHVVMQAELHQELLGFQNQTNEARRCIQDFIARPEVAAQIRHVGLDTDKVAARVAMLSESELLLLQQQIMREDLQQETAGGLTKGGKIMTGIGLGLLAAGVVMIAVDGGTEVGSSSDVSIDWRTTGYIWAGAGAVLLIIGLTRRQ